MATTGIVNGTLLKLFIDDTGTLEPIANLISNDMTFSKDMIETTSKSSSGAKEYIAGHFGASGSCEGRFEDTGVGSSEQSFSNLYTAMVAGTTLTVAYTTNVTGDTKYSGSALISNLSLSSPDNDAASFSCDIQITGAITVATIV